MTSTPHAGEKGCPLSPEAMPNLRAQALSISTQLWLQHGMHPVHVRYYVEDPEHFGVEANISNASDLVKQTGGDGHALVVQGLRDFPEDTHVFCVPHRTSNGEVLVIAEGGGVFSPGAYRVAVHSVMQVAEGRDTQFKFSRDPFDVLSGSLLSKALN